MGENQKTKIDVKNLSPEEREQLKTAIQREEQKNKWTGVWRDFRSIGKDYYNTPVKEMTQAEKKERLKKELESFVSERLS